MSLGGSATTYWTSDYSGVAVLDPIQNTVWLLGPDHSCTGIPKLEDGYRLDPCVGAWSPDGSRFAFYVSASGSGEQGSTLVVVSRSGSEASLATYGPPDGFRFSVRMFPSFADDSTVFAIVTRPEGSSDIYETWGMNLWTH